MKLKSKCNPCTFTFEELDMTDRNEGEVGCNAERSGFSKGKANAGMHHGETGCETGIARDMRQALATQYMCLREKSWRHVQDSD
jgi:hypothetical protein